MIDQINYKVLWVDDDESIIDAYATLAEVNYNLSLDVAPDWETAEEKLRVHFREYSAIILDANCKLNKSDSKPSEFSWGKHPYVFLEYLERNTSLFLGISSQQVQ